MPAYCRQPGCPALVRSGYCPSHTQQARPNLALRRGYRTARWRRLRAQVLVESLYRCAQCDQVTIELEVDHVVKADAANFWDRANLQALCARCHLAKTRRGA